VLASLGANVNVASKEGATAVGLASQDGHDSVVRVLASLGADVNASCKRGWTPLMMMAARMGHVEVVAELLKAGALPKARLPDGRTALALARSNGHKAIVALLEKA
jgi:ankyrin repeat protein